MSDRGAPRGGALAAAAVRSAGPDERVGMSLRRSGSLVSVDENDQAAQLISFALRWYCRGGAPDALIRERFGLEPVRYFAALLWQLSIGPPAPVRPDVVAAVCSVARRRIWVGGLEVLEEESDRLIPVLPRVRRRKACG